MPPDDNNVESTAMQERLRRLQRLSNVAAVLGIPEVDPREEKKEDEPLPLDVSLHSTSTEVSVMTEITTISKREKELDKVLSCLEQQDQEHPVHSILHHLQQDPASPSVPIDTIPRASSITLQEFVGARIYLFSRNVGFAQDEANAFTKSLVHGPQNSLDKNINSHPAQPPPPRKNGLAQYSQDRVDTFARNMETLGSVLRQQQSGQNISVKLTI